MATGPEINQENNLRRFLDITTFFLIEKELQSSLMTFAVCAELACLPHLALHDTYVDVSKHGSEGQPPTVMPMELGVKGFSHGPTDMYIPPRPGSNGSPSNLRHSGLVHGATNCHTLPLILLQCTDINPILGVH